MFAISLAACSSNLTPPSDLLLGPDDFPGMKITEIAREVDATNNEDGPTAQVELRAKGFVIIESLVLFKDRDLALDILSSIKRDQTNQGLDSVPVQGFDDNSGIMLEHLDDEEKATVFFVEGHALVRITVSGEKASASIWGIAIRAREKTKG